ncbi:HAMP domain-containing histidine kinase [Pyxidicoccus fallax]|uniref:histidine kinase n=1 Tax=Pyxidicoccus fallax TaxID=394095 RepID=A0A848LW92_9BACT|nr:HAMP domain-containing sensor histidine kinase [Pyxidicoccus fallax]NMO21693.1 HAMP domain-containing histidine kinase [Pyxidicoccus fallax]NPC82977.1 HAMP domain-containing histidine kinase [Pyxidicoccus fallax]
MWLSAAFALVLMGAFFTLFSYDLEDVIFNRLVAAEADRSEPGHMPGITTYSGHASLPPWLRERLAEDAPQAEYEVSTRGHGHFHVAVRPGAADGKPRYVVFDVTELTSTTSHLRRTSGLLLTSALLALLAAALLGHVVARRLGRPLEQLVGRLREEDGALPEDDGGVAEVRALLEALRARDERIQELLERERRFNRDASHELRTPLAVAQGAVEILELDPPRDAETFRRLRQAVSQMGLLTEGILWLARERRSDERCELLRVSRELVALYAHLRQSDRIEISIESAGEVLAPIPAPVARVMLGNLLKNALAYTSEGRIVIGIEPTAWTLSDTGVGFGSVEPGQEGFGIGLSLVERLARRFSWGLAIDTLKPHGTRVRLTWDCTRPDFSSGEEYGT